MTPNFLAHMYFWSVGRAALVLASPKPFVTAAPTYVFGARELGLLIMMGATHLIFRYLAIAVSPEPFARIDVHILCQGTMANKYGEFERDGWDRVMAVNLDGLTHCARKFRYQLAGTRGSIMIVSLVSGFRANIGNPAYAASKTGKIICLASPLASHVTGHTPVVEGGLSP